MNILEQFIREDIAFNAEGVTLRGWLYRPKGAEKVPAIVMAPRFQIDRTSPMKIR